MPAAIKCRNSMVPFLLYDAYIAKNAFEMLTLSFGTMMEEKIFDSGVKFNDI